MFTRCALRSVQRIFVPMRNYVRKIEPNFNPLHIKRESTRTVSAYDVVAANITLARKDIELYLQSKEVQEKISVNNTQTPITSMFTLLDTDGSILDPKKFNGNELEIALSKMPNFTIELGNIEKSSNDQWYAHLSIIGEFSNLQHKHDSQHKHKSNHKHESQHKHETNIKSKKKAVIKWFMEFQIFLVALCKIIVLQILIWTWFKHYILN